MYTERQPTPHLHQSFTITLQIVPAEEQYFSAVPLKIPYSTVFSNTTGQAMVQESFFTKVQISTDSAAISDTM